MFIYHVTLLLNIFSNWFQLSLKILLNYLLAKSSEFVLILVKPFFTVFHDDVSNLFLFNTAYSLFAAATARYDSLSCFFID